jgi:hypothetical protein
LSQLGALDDPLPKLISGQDQDAISRLRSIIFDERGGSGSQKYVAQKVGGEEEKNQRCQKGYKSARAP